MSRPDLTEFDIPPHFTNIQHGLQLARQYLSIQDTPNRQIILLTDGLPTAHFDGQFLYLLYPPHPLTEEATMREGPALRPAGHHHQHFPAAQLGPIQRGRAIRHRVAESTRGRNLLHRWPDLDRYVRLGLRPPPSIADRVVWM